MSKNTFAELCTLQHLKPFKGVHQAAHPLQVPWTFRHSADLILHSDHRALCYVLHLLHLHILCSRKFFTGTFTSIIFYSMLWHWLPVLAHLSCEGGQVSQEALQVGHTRLAEDVPVKAGRAVAGDAVQIAVVRGVVVRLLGGSLEALLQRIRKRCSDLSVPYCPALPLQGMHKQFQQMVSITSLIRSVLLWGYICVCVCVCVWPAHLPLALLLGRAPWNVEGAAPLLPPDALKLLRCVAPQLLQRCLHVQAEGIGQAQRLLQGRAQKDAKFCSALQGAASLHAHRL